MAADPTDLGAPASYLVLEPGLPVYSCDGEELGRVDAVVADEEDDIFEGIVLDGKRWVAGEQVEEIFERGVLLKLDEAAAENLPPPPR